MKTPYESLDAETRREWLDNPVTEKFLLTLKMELARIDQSIVTFARAGEQVSPMQGASSQALSWVLELARGAFSHDVA